MHKDSNGLAPIQPFSSTDLSDLLGGSPVIFPKSKQALALQLVRQAVPVFPVHFVPKRNDPGKLEKKPAIRGWNSGAASTSETQIQAWWQQWPDAEVGFPTGATTGISILDLDMKDGRDGIAACRAHGVDPDHASPMIAQTRTGGRHLYFRHKKGLRCSSDKVSGIDVRGEDGYAVAYQPLHSLDTLPDWPTAFMPAPRLPTDQRPPEEMTESDWAAVEQALAFVSANCPRDDWRNVGMALHHAGGGSDQAFKLVEGVSDLLMPDSPDLVALVDAVKAQRPALIVIDTLAMAFPGLEENDAKAMGRVVAVARHLARWGVAVVLIHHDTKAEGATPRGHSLLNGALDFALHVKRVDGGIIRGKLTKNRNGSCDRDIAFRIASEDGGTDDDGDAITLPRCHPMQSASVAMRRLPRQAAAALKILETLEQPTARDDWKRACMASDAVCANEKPDTRRKAFDRALEVLTREEWISCDGGFYSIRDGFDELDGHGQCPDISGLSNMDKGAARTDGHGHTP